MQELLSEIQIFLKDINLVTLVLGSIIGFASTIFINWFKDIHFYKKEKVKEMRVLTKDFVDLWSDMRTVALEILHRNVWLEENDINTENQSEKSEKWKRERYQLIQQLRSHYHKAHTLIGYTYFYYKPFRIQNELDDIFFELAHNEWQECSFDDGWEKLNNCQIKGIKILREMKKEFDANISLIYFRPAWYLNVVYYNFINIQFESIKNFFKKDS